MVRVLNIPSQDENSQNKVLAPRTREFILPNSVYTHLEGNPQKTQEYEQ